MRNLTIRRTKKFAACLVTMKVYIEDPLYGDTVINNIPCTKLGELKNGETKTFQIREQNAKVFVIADKLSKNYCNDYYQLPDGEQDIFLTGKNEFNPATGNAFRFDNNFSAEVMANRKKGSFKGLAILLGAIAIGFLIGGFIVINSIFGFISKAPEAKSFSADGMSITLTDNFTEESYSGYTVCYDSKDVAIFVLKEEFTLAEGFEDYTLEQYGNLVIEGNGLTDSQLQTSDGLTYFEYDYEDTANSDTYHYITYVYKADDAFWMIQFATSESDFAKYSSQITNWAKSASFTA